MDINAIIIFISMAVFIIFLARWDVGTFLLITLFVLGGKIPLGFFAVLVLILLLTCFICNIVRFHKITKHDLVLLLWMLSAFLASHFGFGWISI